MTDYRAYIELLSRYKYAIVPLLVDGLLAQLARALP
jgi:hypothetical protein